MVTANTKTATTTARAAPATATKVDPIRLKDTNNPAVWTVIGLKDCPWTKKALSLLEEHTEEFKQLPMTREWHRRLIVEYNCHKSPAVFRGAQYFGSYADLENHYKCWFFTDNELL